MLQTDWQGQTEKQMTGADMTVYDAEFYLLCSIGVEDNLMRIWPWPVKISIYWLRTKKNLYIADISITWSLEVAEDDAYSYTQKYYYNF